MSLYFLRIVEVTVNYIIVENQGLSSKLTRKREREMAGVVREGGGGGKQNKREILRSEGKLKNIKNSRNYI